MERAVGRGRAARAAPTGTNAGQGEQRGTGAGASDMHASREEPRTCPNHGTPTKEGPLAGSKKGMQSKPGRHLQGVHATSQGSSGCSGTSPAAAGANQKGSAHYGAERQRCCHRLLNLGWWVGSGRSRQQHRKTIVRRQQTRLLRGRCRPPVAPLAWAATPEPLPARPENLNPRLLGA